MEISVVHCSLYNYNSWHCQTLYLVFIKKKKRNMLVCKICIECFYTVCSILYLQPDSYNINCWNYPSRTVNFFGYNSKFLQLCDCSSQCKKTSYKIIRDFVSIITFFYYWISLLYIILNYGCPLNWKFILKFELPQIQSYKTYIIWKNYLMCKTRILAIVLFLSLFFEVKVI